MRKLVPPLLAAAVIMTVVSAQDQRATFQSGVEAVSLDVSVRRSGVPVRDLGSEAFDIVDNGSKQQVASATLENVPLSLVVLLDTSDSVRGANFQNLLRAVRAALGTLRSEDRVALVTFASAITVQVPLTTREHAEAALDGLDEPQGATSLRDAVFSALRLSPVPNSRPAVLVFSDGQDDMSWLTERDVMKAGQIGDTVVDAIELAASHSQDPAPVSVLGRTDPNSMSRPIGPAFRSQPAPAPSSLFLTRVVEATGGRHWLTEDPAQLGRLMGQALDDLRVRYLITYYPRVPGIKGWHEVRVRLKQGRGDVLVRPGYFIP